MRIEDVEMDADEEPLQELKGLRVSSFDDDEEEGQNAVDNLNDFDEGDVEDENEEHVPVKLGFLDEPEHSWSLFRQVFPSKAGGAPAWLDPVNLPSGRTCLCDICGEPLQFLLQVYAPISEKGSTFHRTLYVFMCPSMTCLLRDQHEQWKRGPEKPSRSVKVFRCQMPRDNSLYSREPPRYDGTDKPSVSGVPLCAWCGTWKGDKVCSSCRKARYCSEKHQVMHWRTAHKPECQLNVSTQSSYLSCSADGASSEERLKVACKSLWPEYEISCEDESEVDTSISEADGDSNSLITRQQIDETVESLMDSFEGDDDRKSWAVLQEHLAKAPEQVLRYSRDERAKPLWPTSSGRPSREDIPKCHYCGGARNFEFQILPQLLYYFGVKNDADSLDWATIVIYTCADSCEGSVSYKEEFAWVQLVLPGASVA